MNGYDYTIHMQGDREKVFFGLPNSQVVTSRSLPRNSPTQSAVRLKT